MKGKQAVVVVYVCAYVFVCARARACVHVRACVCTCVCVRACVCFMCVRVATSPPLLLVVGPYPQPDIAWICIVIRFPLIPTE